MLTAVQTCLCLNDIGYLVVVRVNTVNVGDIGGRGVRSISESSIPIECLCILTVLTFLRCSSPELVLLAVLLLNY